MNKAKRHQKHSNRHKSHGHTEKRAVNNEYDSYDGYLETPHWEKIREKYKEDFCEVCLAGTAPLYLHHLNYSTLKQEDPRDLITLCSDCHLAAHRKLFRGELVPKERLWDKSIDRIKRGIVVGSSSRRIRSSYRFFIKKVACLRQDTEREPPTVVRWEEFHGLDKPGAAMK